MSWQIAKSKVAKDLKDTLDLLTAISPYCIPSSIPNERPEFETAFRVIMESAQEMVKRLKNEEVME